MFQWLTNGKGRPAGPLGASSASRRISVAVFAPEPVVGTEQNKTQMYVTNLTFIVLNPRTENQGPHLQTQVWAPSITSDLAQCNASTLLTRKLKNLSL